MTVQAELLAPDRRTVLATAFAPVRRLAVRIPVAVKLSQFFTALANVALGPPAVFWICMTAALALGAVLCGRLIYKPAGE